MVATRAPITTVNFKARARPPLSPFLPLILIDSKHFLFRDWASKIAAVLAPVSLIVDLAILMSLMAFYTQAAAILDLRYKVLKH